MWLVFFGSHRSTSSNIKWNNRFHKYHNDREEKKQQKFLDIYDILMCARTLQKKTRTNATHTHTGECIIFLVSKCISACVQWIGYCSIWAGTHIRTNKYTKTHTKSEQWNKARVNEMNEKSRMIYWPSSVFTVSAPPMWSARSLSCLPYKRCLFYSIYFFLMFNITKQ